MRKLEVAQGSSEWHAARRCIVTGTKLDDVMGTALARTQLIAELIAEEATEQTKTIRPTAEMERGNDEEEFAIKLFEKQAGKKLTRGGMWFSDEFDFVGFSPDAYEVSEDGEILEAVEVKNPDSKTAVFYRLANMIPAEELGLTKSKVPWLGIPLDYKWQCVAAFVNNEKLRKLHFLVHDARFIDAGQKLYVTTLDRDNELLQEAIVDAKFSLGKFRSDWLRWKEIVLPVAF